MNRISWHIPLGIVASLVAHLWIFVLVLDFSRPSQTIPRLTDSVRASLEIEIMDRSRDSPGEEKAEPSGSEPVMINKEHTIQFR